MGLFSFKKKKKKEAPSAQAPKEKKIGLEPGAGPAPHLPGGLPDMGVSESQLQDIPELPPDLDTIRGVPLPKEDEDAVEPEAPPPKRAGPAQPKHPGHHIVPSAEKEASYRLVPQAKQGPKAPGLLVEEGFELPDFDDNEITELGKKPEPKPKPEPEPEPEPETKPEEIHPPEPARPKMHGKKFLDIVTYLELKENLDNIKRFSSLTAETMDKHAATSGQKNNKYQELTAALDILQEKLMMIDDKVFESNQDLEVNQ